MKYGIDALKATFDLGFAVGGVTKLALDDGKIDFADLQYVPIVFPTIQPFIDLMPKIPEQIGDIDSDEAKELIAYAQPKLPGVAGEELGRKIGAILKVGIAIAEAVHAFKGVEKVVLRPAA